ncbi:MAG: urocanate hydratase [Bradymonadales bacterium]|jgi:urocanate hydratase
MSDFISSICDGITEELPMYPDMDPAIARAPKRVHHLNESEQELALMNALRYFSKSLHAVLKEEFLAELRNEGHISMHRYRPKHRMRARDLAEYPAKSRAAAAIMMMIQNNLDPDVAQFPYDLVCYGGNGAVFQNWAQYRLTMRYLSMMDDAQTLVLYSGHPLGLFPSSEAAPRVVLTNGMMIPNYSRREDYLRANALGVTSYGQMTAGSFMYIGPQGIVHGTTLTLLNAARRYLGAEGNDALAGRVFVSSGLGGMSGAQAKASVIAGAIGVVAEVDARALKRRYEQAWVEEYSDNLDEIAIKVEQARREKRACSIAYHGNIVDLWEFFLKHDVAVDLGSDQTSLHNPFGGGYFPVGMGFEESLLLLSQDPDAFKRRVEESLCRHWEAIEGHRKRGMHFWDYGNAFLLEASRAGASGILRADGSFSCPSYVEDIMGPLCFDYGFGPFRWVCCSQSDEDLRVCDELAAKCLEEQETQSAHVQQQLKDNIRWIRQAQANNLVVGSKARILYADRAGRINIARAFNEAIATGRLQGYVVLGRDHHDVSGTDSPYRETANIRDGSAFCADMSVHNFIGDAIRGATWVSLHNGGGVGWGESINGGFGMLLDGSAEAISKAEAMLSWDVCNGLSRRAWARNAGAIEAIKDAMASDSRLLVTLPQS